MQKEINDTPSLEEYLGEKEQMLPNSAIQAQISFLQGKVLTIIDAAFGDKRQGKAVKDLIKKAFNDQITWIYQLSFPNTRMMTQGEVASSIGDPEKIASEAEPLP